MTNLTDPHFTNEDKAREHLEALRSPDGPVCPHCGSFAAKRLPPPRGRPTKHHPEGAIRNGVTQCNAAHKQDRAPVGTGNGREAGWESGGRDSTNMAGAVE